MVFHSLMCQEVDQQSCCYAYTCTGGASQAAESAFDVAAAVAVAVAAAPAAPVEAGTGKWQLGQEQGLVAAPGEALHLHLGL